MTSRLVLVLTISTLLVFSALSPALSKDTAADDLDEDLSFLEADDDEDSAAKHIPHSDSHSSDGEGDDEFDDDDMDFGNFDDFEVPSGLGHDEEEPDLPEIDEKDVVVLKDRNFSDFIESNKYVMVEFYAPSPWCGHCQALAPEYAAAATELKAENVTLAKVDAREESEVAEEYGVDGFSPGVEGFPALYFFVDGKHKPYTGQRTKEGIVTWVKKKIGPGVQNILTTADAERILASENKVVLGFLESLVSPESEEIAAASKLDDDVNFYQTTNPDVAKLFHLESDAKRPALVMLKKEAEKLSHFDGKFEKSAIVDFVTANKLPLVNIFTRETASVIFESPIKKQVLLFANSKDSEKVIPTFEEVAKSFKGKLIFVYVDMDNEDVGKPMAEYFGVTGDSPKVIGFSGIDDPIPRKYIFDGEVTSDEIKVFAEDFVQDKLKFYKSDPIPDKNDGDVKIVVSNSFDEIVLDESKDVLLEVYAPWCGQCQALEPTYNKLAKHLRGIESLVIAKMDGTTNEHPKAKVEGFPTILFFPAQKKSSDPITVDADLTVVGLYKFLKKHATTPFKLEKPDNDKASESGTSIPRMNCEVFVLLLMVFI